MWNHVVEFHIIPWLRVHCNLPLYEQVSLGYFEGCLILYVDYVYIYIYKSVIYGYLHISFSSFKKLNFLF